VFWGLFTRRRRQKKKYRIALLHTMSLYAQAWIFLRVVTFIYIPFFN
jgi:hypothetical protein